MTEKNKAKIRSITAERSDYVLRRSEDKKKYIQEYLIPVKKEAQRLGIPFTRLIDKRRSTFMDLSSPSQEIPAKRTDSKPT